MFAYLLWNAKPFNQFARPIFASLLIRATLSEKCDSGGEPLAQLHLIWQARYLNLKPPALQENQILIHNRCVTPKRVTSLRGPSPRHCARAARLRPFEETSQRWKAVGNTDFDFITPRLEPQIPASETNALPFDQLTANLLAAFTRNPT